MRDEHLFIAELLEKYPDLNQEEREQFNRWLEEGENKDFFNQILDKEVLEEELRQLNELKIESEERQSWEKLIRVRQQRGRIFQWNNWKKYTVAASIIMILGVGGLIWFQSKKEDKPVVQRKENQKSYMADASPGQFKAKLILADGSTVILDTTSTGQLAQQGSVKVINKDGKLVYQQGAQNAKAPILYNTLQTTKGQTYTTVLADGSKVWLNSESSIRYPVTFTEQERKVFITGEAYFEVAPATVRGSDEKLIKQTFKVSVRGMEIEVLGTHFNINAYPDEKIIKTTLLEGKVKVSYEGKTALLKPAQQSQVITESGTVETVNNADVEQAVAWKNGFFHFNNDNLRTVMRQLSRWYDLDIEYHGNVPNEIFGGRMDRNSRASEVLTILSESGVHFKIQGKKIIVTQ